MRVSDGRGAITILGLRSLTKYQARVQGFAGGAYITSEPVSFTTTDLPSSLKGAKIEGMGQGSGGYTLLSPLGFQGDSVAYALIFDNRGELRWYRSFHEGVPAADAQQVANGDYLVFVGATHGGEPTYGRYIQVRPSGEVVRDYTATAPLYTDGHEILISFQGDSVQAVYLFGYDFRPGDISFWGGPTDGNIAAHYLLKQDAVGHVQFLWSARDHFSITDWIEPYVNVPPVDFDHPNALALDRDGNYIVSFRNLAEVTKINAHTGAIMWRLGGKHNQFTFINDPSHGFSAQHFVRVLENGNLLLFDNGTSNTPQESRAVEYRLDLASMTATMVWEYRHSPPLYNPYVGSVQRLRNGNTAIGYGFQSRVVEVNTSNQPVWDAQLLMGTDHRPTFFYRAIRIESLYKYASP